MRGGSSAAKLALAFLAGLFTFLGATVVYVHNRGWRPPYRAVQRSSVAADAIAGALPAASSSPDSSAESSDVYARFHRLPPRVIDIPPDAAVDPDAAKPSPAVRADETQATPPQSTLPHSALETAAKPPEQAASAPPVHQQALETPKPVEAKAAVPVPNPTASPAPHVVTLVTGTTVTVKLGESLSTDHNYPGDTFRGTLNAPLIVDGFVIAKEGSLVLGRVVRAEKSHLLGGKAKLMLALTELNTTDGQLIRINTDLYEQAASGHKVEIAPKALAGAAYGAVKDAVNEIRSVSGSDTAFESRPQKVSKRVVFLPAGVQIGFTLSAPVTLTEHLNQR